MVVMGKLLSRLNRAYGRLTGQEPTVRVRLPVRRLPVRWDPPVQYTGWDSYKKDFGDFFALFDGPISDEASDMAIVAEGNLGYSRMIEHVTGKQKNGQPMDMLVRVTDVYRKNKGKWLIIHEHVSVPVDLDSGKAVMQAGK